MSVPELGGGKERTQDRQADGLCDSIFLCSSTRPAAVDLFFNNQTQRMKCTIYYASR